MVEREKVIDILGACGTDDCDNCPLNGDERCSGFVDVPVKVLMDALALLREQEARLMTLDETIASCENPVWIEENTLQGSYGAWGVVKGLHEQYKAVNIGGVRFTYWPRAKYNISWRCWTARPTEEQRKAVAWDG